MTFAGIAELVKDPDAIAALIAVPMALIGIGWIVWATWPSHPERIEKLRQEWGVIPPQHDDLSNDRNKEPRSDQE